MTGYGSRPKVRMDAIGEAWALFQQEMGTWVLAGLVMCGLWIAVGLCMTVAFVALGIGIGAAVGSGTNGGESAGLLMIPLMLCGYIVVFAVFSALVSGPYRMAIKQVRGEPITLGDMFLPVAMWPRIIAANILMALLAAVGTLFFVIPGLIIAGLMFLTLPLIVDRNMGVIEAMGESSRVLKDEWLMAAVFAAVLGFLSGLGVLLLGFGILFTYPLLYLGHAVIYRDAYLATYQQAAVTPTYDTSAHP